MNNRFDKRINKSKLLLSKFKKLKDEIVLNKVREYINLYNSKFITEEDIIRNLKIRQTQVDKAILKLMTEGLLREKNYPSHDREFGCSGWNPTIYEIVKNGRKV